MVMFGKYVQILRIKIYFENHILNKFMERIRKQYICQKQIKKGRTGTRELLRAFKEN